MMTAGAVVRIGFAGGAVAALAALASFAGAEPAYQPPVMDNSQVSPVACLSCHGTGATTPYTESLKYIRLTERTTWEKQDPHSCAHKQIVPDKDKTPIAFRMQTILSKARPAGYRIDAAPECLTCHATDTKVGVHKELKDRTAAEFLTKTGETDIGVGCTACHGHDGRYLAPHFSELPAAGTAFPAFRSRPPANKQSDFGLRDLRNPHVKAALCTSCHVGNPGEGKVVTHEMYAAGHPPLPPFELATFMAAEPEHWGHGAEMPFLADLAKSDAKKAWEFYHARAETVESSAARNVAVGSIAALKAEMAGIAAELTKSKGSLPDFARFDCYACHHDLVIPSPRQEAGYVGAPGRPPLKAWVAAVPGVVAKHAAGMADPGLKGVAAGFDAKWKAVTDAALARPFGDAEPLTAAANDLAKWCDAFQAALDAGVAYPPDEAKKLAAALAAEVVKPHTLRDPEAVATMTWSLAALGGANGSNADALRALSPVHLPARAKETKVVTVGSILDERAKAFREFKPEEFVKKFREVK
jgi:hypothetical protein